MKIKFTKDYINAKKDEIVVVADNTAKRLIADGFAKKTKETIKREVKAQVVVEVTEDVIENKCKECGDTEELCKECNDKK